MAELSKDPKNVRLRMRRKNANVEDEIANLYGKPVEEWDLEELLKGRARNADGTFSTGRRSKVVNSVTQAEIQKRLRQVTREELNRHVGSAIEVLNYLMTDDGVDEYGKPTTPASVKLQAATYLLDQVVGKATAHVEVQGNLEISQMLADVVVNPDGEDAHPVNAEFDAIVDGLDI